MWITVLICSRDRAEDLRRTLTALLCAANLKIPSWDVLVVDNDSKDSTARVCSEFKALFPEHVSYCFEKRHGKSNALNAGIAAAKGDVLAFTDDDVTCAQDYLQAIRTVFEQFPVDAVQGRNLLDCEGGHPVWLDHFLGLTIGWRDDSPEFADLQGTLCGSNMVVRAEVFKKIGSFIPDLGPGAIGLGEETEMTLRMRDAGCRLAFAPQILTTHHLPKKRLTKSFIRRRFFQEGRSQAYYAPLPVPLWRFGVYAMKETAKQELIALALLCRGQQARALRRQAEASSHTGFFWQHYLFHRKKAVRERTGAEPGRDAIKPPLREERALGRE